MKRLLLIAYFYPPLGGPGVQRPLKLVKYLKKFGWQTDVITVKNIVFHSYDEELAKEDAADSVIRAASIDPMAILKKISGGKKTTGNKLYFSTPENIKKYIRKLFPIDEKIGWYPAACRAGKMLIRQKKYDAVMATIGPYTSALIAYKLSRKFQIPLIIDYRDHWTLNPYLTNRAFYNELLGRKWEEKILHQAAAITTIGEQMRTELIGSFGKSLENKIKVMFNGYDESDFLAAKNEKNEKITFRYIGNFYGLRSPRFFVKALENLQRSGRLPADLNVEFIGNFYPESRKHLSDNAVSPIISIQPQVPHKQAVKLLLSCDAALLFIASSAGGGILTGKIFEYLRSGKPILAMIPEDGEAAKLLRRYGHDFICRMEETAAIETEILKMYQAIKERKIPRYNFPPEYSRENQTEELVKFLEAKL